MLKILLYLIFYLGYSIYEQPTILTMLIMALYVELFLYSFKYASEYYENKILKILFSMFFSFLAGSLILFLLNKIFSLFNWILWGTF
jgi:hypothetical protein